MRSAVLTLAVLASLGGAAGAQPVTWAAPDECPDQALVVGEIETLLGGDVDWDRWQSLGATIEASASESGWRVVVTTAQPEGVRELYGATCQEVAEAAALVIAMIIDPEALIAGSAEREVESAKDEEIAPEETATLETTATATTSRSSWRVRWALRGNVVSDIGALPGVIPGLGLTIAARVGRWRAEVSGTYWFERSETLADLPEVGGDLNLLVGGVRGCFRVGAGFDTCAGFELGRFAARGFGTDTPRSATSLWLAPTADVVRGFKITQSFGFSVLGGLAVPLQRPRFNVRDVGGMDVILIHQPSAVVGRVLVGAEWELP